ncbi:F-box/kelch-repeat protein at5g39560 [Phtheirospermum japonicum]|uniref:F-box/kelch-repeat protein at5g39560 n=1 Tax=Phtheirospermum japonicum TaxID=374723 RepID=A0A830BEU1_9LAMI|nr:F-box/kelch-repeat protein at5g39560 [Phtheirospermum japonicum]
MALASHNDAVGNSSSFHTKSLISCSSRQGDSLEGIKCFYMIYDCWNKDKDKDPCSFKCFSMNKSTGETTALTISPAPRDNTREGHAVLLNYTAVAVGPTIYMIGGYCRRGFCPGGAIDDCHRHAEVRFFNALRPEEGWTDAAPMHIPRLKPTAVVVDGMIYVFGGSGLGLEAPVDGECFDPKTNKWRLFSATGCQPSFACVQAPYVDPNGTKQLLVNSNHQNMKTLYKYILDEQKWEIVSDDFGKCTRPGAVVGNIIYTVLDNYGEKQPLHGYHLIHKRWYPVDLPEIEGIRFGQRQVVFGVVPF